MNAQEHNLRWKWAMADLGARLRSLSPQRLILLAFLLLSLTYNVVTPIGESDNELSHFRYIQYVRTHWRLPPLDYEWPSPPTARCSLPAAKQEHQFRQPPLYYVLNAVVFAWLDMSDPWWPDANPYGYHALNLDGGRNAFLHTPEERFPYRGVALVVHLIRLLSTIIGLVGLLAVARAARLLFPEEPRAAWAMTALVAFNPAYIFAASVINNDILVGALGLWAVYFALRGLLTPHVVTSLVGMGVMFALALISKYTAVLLAPFLVLAGLVALARGIGRIRQHEWQHVIRWLPLLIVVALLVGWWFWRNWTLYGELLPGYRATAEALDQRLRALRRRSASEQVNLFLEGVNFTFITYWGLLGADALLLPPLVLSLLKGVGILVAAGLGARLLLAKEEHPRRWIAVLALVGIIAGWLVGFISVLYAPRGRYLLSMYGLGAFLFVWGGKALRVPGRRWSLAEGFALVLPLLALYAALGVIRPAFLPPPTDLSLTPTAEEMPLYARVDDLAELISIEIQPRDVTPGEWVTVSLRWRVLAKTENNYVVGVHLTSINGEHLGGTAHWPANGRYPTSLWQPGDVFRDTYRFRVKEKVEGELPIAARVLVSVYCQDEEGERELSFYDPAGNRIGTFVLSAPVRVSARTEEQSPLPPVVATFGDVIGLVEVTGVPESPGEAGANTTLRMVWAALSDPERDYTVYVQVLDERNQVRIGADYPLGGDRLPTHLWRRGDQVVHEHPIDLSGVRRLPPGTYRLVMGLYHLETGERLPLSGGERASPEGYVLAQWDVPEWQRSFLPLVEITQEE